MLNIYERFLTEKTASIWSDWCSSGVWDAHGVNITTDWLPVSRYALALINAMQTVYDWRCSMDGQEFDAEHFAAYETLQAGAVKQVRLELTDWVIK